MTAIVKMAYSFFQILVGFLYIFYSGISYKIAGFSYVNESLVSIHVFQFTQQHLNLKESPTVSVLEKNLSMSVL